MQSKDKTLTQSLSRNIGHFETRKKMFSLHFQLNLFRDKTPMQSLPRNMGHVERSRVQWKQISTDLHLEKKVAF